MVHPLSLRLYPDPALRGLCCPVEQFDSGLSDLLADMLELMRAYEGIGLAAPQVGITQRLFVAEIHGCSVCLVNPVITGRGGSDRMAEGCLSLPSIHVDVRSAKEYEQVRLPGSTLIPLGALRGRLQELPRDKEIVAFCKISLRGYEAALILTAAGFQKVRVMDGGVVAWPFGKLS